MLWRYKAQILVWLLAQDPEDYFHLIVFWHRLAFLRCALSHLLIFARTQRKARISLKQKSYFLKLWLEHRLFLLLVNHIDHEFVQNTPKTPHVWGLIVLLLNDWDFRGSVPPWSDVERHESFLCLSARTIIQEYISNNLVFVRKIIRCLQVPHRQRIHGV